MEAHPEQAQHGTRQPRAELWGLGCFWCRHCRYSLESWTGAGLGLGKGFLTPPPRELPLLGPAAPAPAHVCLLQQLPACGGAHASAWPRRGGLLPAVRVPVRGAQHHHHQGSPTAVPTPPAPHRRLWLPDTSGLACFGTAQVAVGLACRLVQSQAQGLTPPTFWEPVSPDTCQSPITQGQGTGEVLDAPFFLPHSFQFFPFSLLPLIQ